MWRDWSPKEASSNYVCENTPQRRLRYKAREDSELVPRFPSNSEFTSAAVKIDTIVGFHDATRLATLHLSYLISYLIYQLLLILCEAVRPRAFSGTRARRRMRSALAVSARAGTAAASSTDREQLSRFSAGLYCGGAVDHHCPLPGSHRGVPGACFWLREKGNSWSPVAAHDMQSSHLRKDLDRWDPSAFGQEGFRRFNKREAAQCLQRQRYAATLADYPLKGCATTDAACV